jgi:hypothetical protein
MALLATVRPDLGQGPDGEGTAVDNVPAASSTAKSEGRRCKVALFGASEIIESQRNSPILRKPAPPAPQAEACDLMRAGLTMEGS